MGRLVTFSNKRQEHPLAKPVRILCTLLLLVAALWAPIWLGALGGQRARTDVATPYDYAYKEEEAYVIYYDSKGQPIWGSRETGRILHETRYNHTEAFPWAAWQGWALGFCITGAASVLLVLIWGNSP